MGLLGDNGVQWGDMNIPAPPPEMGFNQALAALRAASFRASAGAAFQGDPQATVYGNAAAEQQKLADQDPYAYLYELRNKKLTGDRDVQSIDQSKQTTSHDKQTMEQQKTEFDRNQRLMAASDALFGLGQGGGATTGAPAPAAAAAGVPAAGVPAAGVPAAGVPAAGVPAAGQVPGAPAPADTPAPATNPILDAFAKLTPTQQAVIRAETDPSKRMEWLQKFTSKTGDVIKYQTPDGREVSAWKRASDGQVVPIEQSGLPMGSQTNPYSNTKMTKEESDAADFANRAARSHVLLNQHETGGLSSWANAGENVPGISRFQTEDVKQFQQARDDFVTAMLRRQSGAAISNGEYTMAYKTYIPQPGDSDAVLKQKAEARARIVEGGMGAANGGYTAPQGWEDPKATADHAQLGRGGAKIGVYGNHQYEIDNEGNVRYIGKKPK